MKQIEWHLAGMIICDECGKDTFFRCLLVRPADQKDAHVVRPPAIVKCAHCGTEYDVIADNGDPDNGHPSH